MGDSDTAYEFNAGRTPLALLCMPFYSAKRPSIQLGLLQAVARREGFPCDTFHLNIDLARTIGPARYEILAEHRGRMTGEWLFGVAAFGSEVASDEAPFMEAFPEQVAELLMSLDADAAWLSSLRQEVLPAFVEKCATSVDWGRYRVVGFTSTFQQNVASIALARLIRHHHPNTTILFGGANFEGDMGPAYLEAVPWIDFAIVGEADHALPRFLRAMVTGTDPTTIPGVAANRGQGVVLCAPADPIADLDDLPIPSYDEYFERAATLDVGSSLPYPHTLPFESSRGCWWGQKHHCTFCGLNGESMAYRSKRPERVVEELVTQAKRYCRTAFEAVDNILDLSYLSGVFGELARTDVDLEIFYEVKAQLTQQQLALLHRGGMRVIQAGIESLSTHVLDLMRKGTTMLKNVRLLKWAAYHGIWVSWNVLWGFPGETDDDYVQQLRVMQLMSHLGPPGGCGPIWLERFSPYFTDPASPLVNVRPEASYAHCYPSGLDLRRAAYFFEYDVSDVAGAASTAPIDEFIKMWQTNWNSATPDTLTFRRVPNGIIVDDRRMVGRGSHPGTYAFQGTLAHVYLSCTDSMQTVDQLRDQIDRVASGRLGSDRQRPDPGEVSNALEELCERGLMLTESGQYLALALPATRYWGRDEEVRSH